MVTYHIITGDAKSEADHNLKSYNSGSGYAAFGLWGPTYFYYRDAYDGGYLQYDLDLAAGENTVNDRYYLQVIYFGSEPTGFGNFKIYVDGTVVAPVGSISYLAPLDHKVLYYPINTTLTQGKNKVTVKFADGRLSLYGIKIMKAGNIIVALKKLGLPVATKIELPTADSSDNKIQNNYKGIYNLLGQKLDKTQGGINIIDGEKVFLTK